MASVLFIPFLLGESMVRFVEDLWGTRSTRNVHSSPGENK
jgi:hypothetical protein